MPPGYTSKLATIPEDTTDTSIQETSRPKTPPNVSYFTSEWNKIQSTPARATLGGYSGEDHKTDIIRPQLKKDMEGSLVTGLPVEDFVKAVWGLDRAKLREKEHTPGLSAEEVARYHSPRLEITRYIPFTAILAQLLLDYISYMRQHNHLDEVDLPCGVFFEARLGHDVVHGDGGSQRKPDAAVTAQIGEAIFARLREIGDKSARMVLTAKDKLREGVRLIWEYLLAFFEFKKKKKSDSFDDEEGPTLDTRATVSELPPRKHALDTSDDPSPAPKRRKGPSSKSISAYPIVPIPSAPLPVTSAGDSDSRELVDTRKVLNDDELQAADYAHESLRTGHRRYSTGIFIDDDIVTLWYYDRMGAVRSKPFDFVREPNKLLAVVIALASATVTNFGFEPMICTPGPSASLPPPAPVKGKNGKAVDLSRSKDPVMRKRVRQIAELTKLYDRYRTEVPPDENLTDCYFRISCRVNLADRPLFEVPSSSPSRVAATKSSTSFLSWIWPSSRPKTETVPPRSDVVFKIKGRPLYVQDGLVGRGTVVLHVEIKEDEEYQFPPDIITKISYPPRSRIPEDSIIRHVRYYIPERWRNHVTGLSCSTTLSMPREDDSLTEGEKSAASSTDDDLLEIPRKDIMVAVRARIKRRDQGDLDEEERRELSDAFIGPEYEERVLRVLVCEKNLPLNRVEDLDEFKSVFRDVVKAHYVVYTKAGILHRDLSVNNIMFKRDPSTNRAIGVLNDWDLAIPVNRSEHKVEKPTSHHRTGTATFMSLELLEDENKTIPHLYRHDLESFMWILIWCGFNFLFRGVEIPFKLRDAVVRDWVDINWQRISQSKNDFLKKYSRALEKTTKAMQPLVEDVLGPISQGIGRAFSERGLTERQYRGLARFRVSKTNFFDEFFTFNCLMEALEPEVEDPVAALW